MTKIETVTTFTGLAGHYEKKDYEMIGKIIYETLAAAKDISPAQAREQILAPLPEVGQK